MIVYRKSYLIGNDALRHDSQRLANKCIPYYISDIRYASVEPFVYLEIPENYLLNNYQINYVRELGFEEHDVRDKILPFSR